MQPGEEIATKRRTPHVVARPKPSSSAPRRAAARNRLHEISPRLLGCYQRRLRPANIGDGNSGTSKSLPQDEKRRTSLPVRSRPRPPSVVWRQETDSTKFRHVCWGFICTCGARPILATATAVHPQWHHDEPSKLTRRPPGWLVRGLRCLGGGGSVECEQAQGAGAARRRRDCHRLSSCRIVDGSRLELHL